MSGPNATPAFIGRQRELSTLLGAIEDRSGEIPRVFVVVGEAGIGKSRLVREVAARAARAGIGVLTGRCLDYQSSGLPYGPFREAIAVAIGEEKAAALFGGSDTAPDARRRLDLFERVADQLAPTGESNPVLLIIEDLHWSDQSTRDLLGFLAARARGNLHMVLTVRREEAAPSGEVAGFLVDLEARGLAQRMHLGPLSPEEVSLQVRAILGALPDDEMLDSIRFRADGNPFYVEELTAAAAAGRGRTLPPTIADVILVRLAELDPPVQEVLRLCAVGGHRIVHTLLRAVANVTDDDLEAALRVAVHRQLLRADDDRREDAYAFRHALVQETIYADMLPPERTRMHRRFAEALVDRPALITDAALSASELARHFEAAHELGAARAAWIEAGRAAYRELALPEADACFARALALPAPKPQDRIAELELLAEAYGAAIAAGRYGRAVELVRLAISQVASDDLERRAMLYQQLSTALWDEGHAAEAEQASAESARLAEPLPASEGKASALISLASVELVLGFPDRALDGAMRSYDIATRAGSERLAILALAYIGPSLVELGQIQQGMTEVRRGWELARHSGDVDLMTTTANHYLLSAGVGLGPMAGLAVARELVATAERLRIPQLAGNAEYLHGNYLFAVGRWNQAEAAYRASAGEEVSRPFAPMPASGMAILHAARGNVEAARLQLATAADLTLQTHELSVALPVVRAQAFVELAAGDPEAAIEAVERGLRMGLPGAWDSESTIPLLLLGLRAAADLAGGHGAREGQGAGAAARTARVAADRYASRLSDLLPPGSEEGPHHATWRALGGAEAARARGADAPDDWRRIAEKAASAHMPPDRGYALLRQGEALARDAVRRPEALLVLTEAHQVAEELGATPLAREVERLARRSRLPLASAGIPGRRRRAGRERGIDQLTDREREVLSLVAAGRSNRQIAEALFITEKTAGAHVSNILAKLGVASRGEASAIAVRDQLVEL